MGSSDNKLYAINPDGTKKWEFVAGSDVFSSPAIASDGGIDAGWDDNKIYAINPDGTKKWEYDAGSDVFATPANSSDSTKQHV